MDINQKYNPPGLTIVATGYHIPQQKVTNEELSQIVDTSDEWIFSRTGIHSRYFCSDKESCVSMATSAASSALEHSHINISDVGAIICATISGDYATPSVACMVSSELKAPEDIPCMDVNAACSGFLYALETARGMLLAHHPDKYAIVIGCEHLSKLLDRDDRSTLVLFGDGAGCAIVKLSEKPYASTLGARGDTAIVCGGVNSSDPYIRMDGKAVFRFAVEALPKCIQTLENKTGLKIAFVDMVICHQANSRIIDHCIKKYHAPASKFYKNMDRFGNTSGASIPIALAECMKKGLIGNDSTIMLVGFGSGLTWGGVLITIQTT